MPPPPLERTAPPDTYRARRARFAAPLDRPVVFLAGHAAARNYATNPYPFRAESSYLYFGGPPLEHAALLIEPGSDGENGCRLFRVPADKDDPLWFGTIPDDLDIAQAAGLHPHTLANADRLADAVGHRMTAAFVPPHPGALAIAQQLCLATPNEKEKLAVIHLRLHKDAAELTAMREAAQVAIRAHRAALSVTAVGQTEFAVEAALVGEMIRHGCQPSFTPIVSVRGEVLHGQSTSRALRAGDLILVDAGAEEPGGYASDITRTYPATGSWSAIQRHLYDTVRRAQNIAIDRCRPGTRYRDIHRAAGRALCEGLVEAELLRGEPASLTERGAYALFFPHGVGHLLGLGVHDLEEFGDLAGYAPGRVRPERFGDCFLRLDRDLEPGMVVTIEPGIYLVPDLWQRDDLVAPHRDVIHRAKVEALLRDGFGGIRLEEDVVVSESEPEILTLDLPGDADAVAALVGRGIDTPRTD